MGSRLSLQDNIGNELKILRREQKGIVLELRESLMLKS